MTQSTESVRAAPDTTAIYAHSNFHLDYCNYLYLHARDQQTATFLLQTCAVHHTARYKSSPYYRGFALACTLLQDKVSETFLTHQALECADGQA